MANEQNLKPFTKDNAAIHGAKGGTNKKGTKHVSTWIDELLHDDTFTATLRKGINIEEYKGAPVKAIVGAQIHLAVNGDSKATDLLFKYGYGTKQEIEHTGAVNTGISDPKLAAEFTEFLKQKTKDE